jgi:hypothetical protein
VPPATDIFSRHSRFHCKGQAMDFQLTEQQRRMVAAVRELAQGEFKANAQK